MAAARAGVAYPAGAVLGLVTWRQREDPHWFGARIPGSVVSVEFVEVGEWRIGSLWGRLGGRWRGVPAKEIVGMKAAVAP